MYNFSTSLLTELNSTYLSSLKALLITGLTSSAGRISSIRNLSRLFSQLSFLLKQKGRMGMPCSIWKWYECAALSTRTIFFMSRFEKIRKSFMYIPCQVWKHCQRKTRWVMRMRYGSRQSRTTLAQHSWLAVNTISSKCLERFLRSSLAQGRMLTPASMISPFGKVMGTLKSLMSSVSLQWIRVQSRSRTMVLMLGFLRLALTLIFKCSISCYEGQESFLRQLAVEMLWIKCYRKGWSSSLSQLVITWPTQYGYPISSSILGDLGDSFSCLGFLIGRTLVTQLLKGWDFGEETGPSFFSSSSVGLSLRLLPFLLLTLWLLLDLLLDLVFVLVWDLLS